MKKKFYYIPNFILSEDEEKGVKERICNHQQCNGKGEYRAPKSRRINEYLWFCLDHVKEYNQQWDYYKGMSQAEIETHQKDDMTWQRPTWPLGERNRSKFDPARRTAHDPFGAYNGTHPSNGKKYSPFKVDSEENKALILMNLEVPLKMQQLKDTYKSLVKKYHPDHNPNDPVAEDRLKEINHAYAVLKRVVEKSSWVY